MRYGDVVAVDGVDLAIDEGEVVGIVGPNGAGKTSLVECLEGLRKPAGGQIRVPGWIPARPGADGGEVGVQLQHSSYPTRIRVGELCRLFAGFYPNPADHRELLDEFDLVERT